MTKKKIITGFPCNGGKGYMIITENNKPLLTTNKDKFDKVMQDDFVELEDNR